MNSEVDSQVVQPQTTREIIVNNRTYKATVEKVQEAIDEAAWTLVAL